MGQTNFPLDIGYLSCVTALFSDDRKKSLIVYNFPQTMPYLSCVKAVLNLTKEKKKVQVGPILYGNFCIF